MSRAGSIGGGAIILQTTEARGRKAGKSARTGTAPVGGNTGVVRGPRNVITRAAATGGGTRMMTLKSAGMIIPEEVVDIDLLRGLGVDPHGSIETQAPEVLAKATVRVVNRRHAPGLGPTKGRTSAQPQTGRGGFTLRTMIVIAPEAIGRRARTHHVVTHQQLKASHRTASRIH